MPCMPDHQPQRLRLHIILLEVAAFILGLSAIALSQQSVALLLVGGTLIALHTLIFYLPLRNHRSSSAASSKG